MTSDAVAIAAIVMLGVLLSVIAWQLLAIARTAIDRQQRDESEQLRSRLHALEALHEGRGDEAPQG